MSSQCGPCTPWDLSNQARCIFTPAKCVTLCCLVRSQLLLAAELVVLVGDLPRRLDYMQHLLGVEELGVVERCELAARLLLSVRRDLRPHQGQPTFNTNITAWWSIHGWDTPAMARQRQLLQHSLLTPVEAAAKESCELQLKLNNFLQEFFHMAGKVRHSWHTFLMGLITSCLHCKCDKTAIRLVRTATDKHSVLYQCVAMPACQCAWESSCSNADGPVAVPLQVTSGVLVPDVMNTGAV